MASLSHGIVLGLGELGEFPTFTPRLVCEIRNVVKTGSEKTLFRELTRFKRPEETNCRWRSFPQAAGASSEKIHGVDIESKWHRCAAEFPELDPPVSNLRVISNFEKHYPPNDPMLENHVHVPPFALNCAMENRVFPAFAFGPQPFSSCSSSSNLFAEIATACSPVAFCNFRSGGKQGLLVPAVFLRGSFLLCPFKFSLDLLFFLAHIRSPNLPLFLPFSSCFLSFFRLELVRQSKFSEALVEVGRG